MNTSSIAPGLRGATIISLAASLGMTIWLMFVRSAIPLCPSSLIVLVAVIGCCSPLFVGRVSVRHRGWITVGILILLWAWLMFFFNGIALLMLPAGFSTAWLIKGFH